MIYADFNGSAPICLEVKNYLLKRIEEGPFANPNSSHCLGQKIKNNIEKCRYECSKFLGAKSSQLIFNSGSSEGITAVFHHILATEKEKKTIVISTIEHAAIVKASEYLVQNGFQLKYAPVNESGVIDLLELENILKENDVALVSIMHANNETGIIQPIEEIQKLCHEYQAKIFSDTTQSIGKVDFDFSKLNLDFATLSGHKIGALIGSGILFIKDPQNFTPHIFGGGQEAGIRGGTQNYIGIETLSVALNYIDKNQHKVQNLQKARESFETSLKKECPDVVIFGDEQIRTPSTSLISFPGIPGHVFQSKLKEEQIFVSTSSACSDSSQVTSKVLKAMKVSDHVGIGAIRISLGCCDNVTESYDKILHSLINIYKQQTNRQVS